MDIQDANVPPIPMAEENTGAVSFVVSFTPALNNTLHVDYSTNAGMKLYKLQPTS
jgi:hypothetical protein